MYSKCLPLLKYSIRYTNTILTNSIRNRIRVNDTLVTVTPR